LRVHADPATHAGGKHLGTANYTENQARDKC
jgi:hypothetical protein